VQILRVEPFASLLAEPLARPRFSALLIGLFGAIALLLAGIGLGLTNTPVTNTTTGAVSGDRAGMASGIDLSARLITLAINIALMGLILVGGVYRYLRSVVAGVDEPGLRRIAEEVASGKVLPGSSPDVMRAALIHGFEGVLLYGGLGVGVLAVISYIIFMLPFKNATPRI